MLDENEFIKLINKDEEIEESNESVCIKLNEGIFNAIKYVRSVLRQKKEEIEDKFIVERKKKRRFY